MNVSNSAFYKDLQALKLDPNRSDRIFAEDRCPGERAEMKAANRIPLARRLEKSCARIQATLILVVYTLAIDDPNANMAVALERLRAPDSDRSRPVGTLGHWDRGGPPSGWRSGRKGHLEGDGWKGDAIHQRGFAGRISI